MFIKLGRLCLADSLKTNPKVSSTNFPGSYRGLGKESLGCIVNRISQHDGASGGTRGKVRGYLVRVLLTLALCPALQGGRFSPRRKPRRADPLELKLND